MADTSLPKLTRKHSETPFFQNLQNEVDRVFEEFRELNPWRGEPLLRNGKLSPKLDISETASQLEITTDLPGVKLDDIDISVTDNVLTIHGEKTAEEKKEDKNYHLIERAYGSFARSIPLDFSPEPDAVTAAFADGVLTISIKKPKELAAKTKKIKVTKA